MSLWYLLKNLFQLGPNGEHPRHPTPVDRQLWWKVYKCKSAGMPCLLLLLHTILICGWIRQKPYSDHEILKKKSWWAKDGRSRGRRRERMRTHMGPWQSPWATALTWACYVWMFCNETQMKFHLFKLPFISQASCYLHWEHLLNQTNALPWLRKGYCENNASV